MLAVGDDERDRRQYIYHERWRSLRDQLNFYRLHRLRRRAAGHPRRRRQAAAATRASTPTGCSVPCCASSTSPGCASATRSTPRRTTATGSARCRSKHVQVHGARMDFRFPAKSGQDRRGVGDRRRRRARRRQAGRAAHPAAVHRRRFAGRLGGDQRAAAPTSPARTSRRRTSAPGTAPSRRSAYLRPHLPAGETPSPRCSPPIDCASAGAGQHPHRRARPLRPSRRDRRLHVRAISSGSCRPPAARAWTLARRRRAAAAGVPRRSPSSSARATCTRRGSLTPWRSSSRPTRRRWRRPGLRWLAAAGARVPEIVAESPGGWCWTASNAGRLDAAGARRTSAGCSRDVHARRCAALRLAAGRGRFFVGRCELALARGRRLERVLPAAPLPAARPPRRPRARGGGGARRGAGRAAGPAARRPVDGQRARRPRRPAVADRSGRIRRAPRDRSRDARRCSGTYPAPHARRLRGGQRRSPTVGGTASPMWQLFPLLVHAVLFGGGYLRQCATTSPVRLARRQNLVASAAAAQQDGRHDRPSSTCTVPATRCCCPTRGTPARPASSPRSASRPWPPPAAGSPPRSAAPTCRSPATRRSATPPRSSPRSTLPVSADLENGFADDPAGVADTVARRRAAGLAGCSIEDATGRADDPIYPPALAAERVAAAVEAAGDDFVHHRAGREPPARARRPRRHHRPAAALPGGRRARALRARAHRRPTTCARWSAEVDRPVNVLALPGAPTVAELAELGVARISVGGAFAFAALRRAGRGRRELLDAGHLRLLGAARRPVAGRRGTRLRAADAHSSRCAPMTTVRSIGQAEVRRPGWRRCAPAR